MTFVKLPNHVYFLLTMLYCTCLVTYIYLVTYICPTKFSGVGFCPTKFKLCPTKIKSDRTNVLSSQIFICSPDTVLFHVKNTVFLFQFVHRNHSRIVLYCCIAKPEVVSSCWKNLVYYWSATFATQLVFRPIANNLV